MEMVQIVQNMALFGELVSCGSNIYVWCYNADGQLLQSNCPHEALLGTAFSLFGCKDRMLQQGRDTGSPIILGTAIGLMWGAAFERHEGVLHRAYVIGPAFFSDVSMHSVENGFKHYANLEVSLAWKHQLLDVLPQLPVAQNIVFSRYMLMLHYCLTGEKLGVSDLHLQTTAGPALAMQTEQRDRHKVWLAEQAMLQMVRTGDLNYKAALNNSFLSSNGVPVQGSDPLRQAKDSIIVFASIVCRAAIEGGLSPEEAYALGDSYIQSTERAIDYSDLTAIAPLMYDDFVRRVHKCRTNPKLSKQVQKCCDYIEMNLGKRIRAADLAALVGYTEYYITRRFKEEVGCPITDYIKFAKIERAKVLLASTDLSVQDISEQLCFGSRSYFSLVFREVTGLSPVEFRSPETTGQ